MVGGKEMTIKQIESLLVEYKKSTTAYQRREKALEELKKIRMTPLIQEMPNVCFIVDNYPKYDHFLFRLIDDNFFLYFGLSRDYINRLNKKELHQVAKAIHQMFGQFNLYNEEGND